jgi:undecaprenyl-diphosphatase
MIKFNLIESLRNYKVIGWTTILFGILLYLSDQIKIKKKINKDFSFKNALYIGLFQILSLMPGVSRAGITITAGRFLKFNRVDSAKISFLISIPTLSAVSVFNIFSIYETKDFTFSLINLLAIFLSFFFSYITIKYFLYYIKKFSLTLFVVYRLLLGVLILFFSYF